ncbi:peptidase S49 [Marinosulfonomonas sp. PRT-SC04]|nr:peptidase S49 [Marinosulfonomonas sp. PRT-SC04]
MSKPTISQLVGAAPMAFSMEHGSALLGLSLPDEALGAGFAQAGSGDSVIIERGERFAISRGVAVVPVRGMLTPNFFALEKWFGWSTYHGLEETMAELHSHDDVDAVVLEIDTPGGFVLGLEAASTAIARLAAIKPVHALVNPMAASAGYWIASQATDIAMTPGSVVGSIGVAAYSSSSVKPDMYGNKWFDMPSSHAAAKRPDPATDKGRAEIMRDIDAIEVDFHAAVAAGRGIPLSDLAQRLTVTDDVADGGAVYRGPDALERGLADTIETRAAFYERIFSVYAPAPRKSAKAFAAKAAAALAISQT